MLFGLIGFLFAAVLSVATGKNRRTATFPSRYPVFIIHVPYHPSLTLASKLQWPALPYLDNSSTFFYVGLFANFANLLSDSWLSPHQASLEMW